MITKIWNAIIGRKQHKKEDSMKIDYETLRQQIRELAYSKWEEAGRPWGQDKEFWIDAEKELFGENPLVSGGYNIVSENGSRILVCPINSEVSVEFAALSDPAEQKVGV